MYRNRQLTGFSLLLAALLTLASPASADEAGDRAMSWLDASAGRWRLESAVMAGVHSGSRSRKGDINVTASIEYEMPAWKRASFGIRFMPLFLYDEKRDDDDSQTIYGAGLGLMTRIYSNAETRSGFFAEAGASLVGQSDKFEGNSGSANFLTELGVGYQWQAGWHVTVKAQHLSNAGLAEHNSGVNAVGMGVGFTF